MHIIDYLVIKYDDQHDCNILYQTPILLQQITRTKVIIEIAKLMEIEFALRKRILVIN